jgi:intron-binding protein aquarius
VLVFFFYSQEKLRSIATYLNLVPPPDKAEEENWFRFDNDFLLELLV